MKVMIITQNEPIYITDTVTSIANKLLGKHEIDGCVVYLRHLFEKVRLSLESPENVKIFGIRFFAYYGINYILSKLTKKSY